MDTKSFAEFTNTIKAVRSLIAQNNTFSRLELSKARLISEPIWNFDFVSGYRERQLVSAGETTLNPTWQTTSDTPFKEVQL